MTEEGKPYMIYVLDNKELSAEEYFAKHPEDEEMVSKFSLDEIGRSLLAHINGYGDDSDRLEKDLQPSKYPMPEQKDTIRYIFPKIGMKIDNILNKKNGKRCMTIGNNMNKEIIKKTFEEFKELLRLLEVQIKATELYINNHLDEERHTPQQDVLGSDPEKII